MYAENKRNKKITTSPTKTTKSSGLQNIFFNGKGYDNRLVTDSGEIVTQPGAVLANYSFVNNRYMSASQIIWNSQQTASNTTAIKVKNRICPLTWCHFYRLYIIKIQISRSNIRFLAAYHSIS